MGAGRADDTSVTVTHPRKSGCRLREAVQECRMMRVMLVLFQRLVILAVIAMGLAATGFAHRVPSADDSARQSFVLAGGAVSELCVDAEGHGPSDHGDCPACHIVGSVDLPPAMFGLRDANLAFVAAVVAPRESRAVRSVLDPARGTRAPPLA